MSERPTGSDEKPPKFNVNTQQASTTEGNESSPTSLIFAGLFLVVAGVGLYLYLSDLEARNASSSINVIVAVLYDIGGKNLVGGLFGGVGALMILWGGYSWINENR